MQKFATSSFKSKVFKSKGFKIIVFRLFVKSWDKMIFGNRKDSLPVTLMIKANIILFLKFSKFRYPKAFHLELVFKTTVIMTW